MRTTPNNSEIRKIKKKKRKKKWKKERKISVSMECTKNFAIDCIMRVTIMHPRGNPHAWPSILPASRAVRKTLVGISFATADRLRLVRANQN